MIIFIDVLNTNFTLGASRQFKNYPDIAIGERRACNFLLTIHALNNIPEGYGFQTMDACVTDGTVMRGEMPSANGNGSARGGFLLQSWALPVFLNFFSNKK